MGFEEKNWSIFEFGWERNLSLDFAIYKSNGKPTVNQLPGYLRMRPKANRSAVNIGTISKYAKIGNKVSNLGYLLTGIELYNAQTGREKAQIIGGVIGEEILGKAFAYGGTYLCPGYGTFAGAYFGAYLGDKGGRKAGAFIYDFLYQ